MENRTSKPAQTRPPTLVTSKTLVTIYLTPEDDRSSNPAVTLMLNANNTAIVVPEKVVLHKDFLCHYSPFFNAAFNGTFKEEHLGPKSLVLLARVWILAERFLLPKLQNMAMDEIYENFYGVGFATDQTDFDFFVDFWVKHLPPAMLGEAVIRLKRRQDRRQIRFRGASDFHVKE
ncbi:hypothetical protein V8E51_002914 [Hyaloscypha variabilis]